MLGVCSWVAVGSWEVCQGVLVVLQVLLRCSAAFCFVSFSFGLVSCFFFFRFASLRSACFFFALRSRFALVRCLGFGGFVAFERALVAPLGYSLSRILQPGAYGPVFRFAACLLVNGCK